MVNRIVRSVLILSLFILFISCNKDIENAKIEGVVYDKISKETLSNIKLKIINWYYEGGDYDSYNKSEEHVLYTDKNGVYKITLKKSAFLELDVIREGYITKSLGKEVITNNIELDFYLEKK